MSKNRVTRIILVIVLIGLLLFVAQRCSRRAVEMPVITREYRSFLPYVSTYIPKKGVTVGHCGTHCGDIWSIGVSWYYDWGMRPLLCRGVEAVPMLDRPVHAVRLLSGGSASLGGNSRYVLIFNEPDMIGGANLAPEEAARLWHGLEGWFATHDPGRRLISPAPSHLRPEWLEQFRDAYVAEYECLPKLDALAIHCYLPSAIQCQVVVEQVIGYAIAWGCKDGVWVTEFAFNENWTPDAELEAAKFIAWMEREPMVRRYSWFTMRMSGDEWWAGGSLHNWSPLADCETGELTDWGRRYK